MATVSFVPGDAFSFPSGYGIVLPDGKAFTIGGEGGRSGYTQKKGEIPVEALPVLAEQYAKIHFEVRFALDAVKIAVM